MRKKWIEEKCVFCTLCIALCPYEAIKQEGGRIKWIHTKCVDCEECLPSIGCPRRAIIK